MTAQEIVDSFKHERARFRPARRRNALRRRGRTSHHGGHGRGCWRAYAAAAEAGRLPTGSRTPGTSALVE